MISQSGPSAPIEIGLPGRQPIRSSGPQGLSVLLIDDMRLTRECLVHLLRDGAPDFEIKALARCADARADFVPPVQIVLFDIKQAGPTEAPVREDLALLAAGLPGVPVLLLSGKEDHAAAFRAIHLGLFGLFPTSLGAELLVAAIRLVVAGGGFVPLAILRNQAEQLFGRHHNGPEE